jgi:hypothetical protein
MRVAEGNAFAFVVRDFADRRGLGIECDRGAAGEGENKGRGANCRILAADMADEKLENKLAVRHWTLSILTVSLSKIEAYE